MNCKIRTESKKHAREILDVLAKLGYVHEFGDSILNHKKLCFFIDGAILRWHWDDDLYFEKHRFPEINLQQLKDKLMKKPNTRPKSYEGCHPVIAEALKQGLEIECEAHRSGSEVREWITNYRANNEHPYQSSTAFSSFSFVEPYYPPRLKPFPKLIKTLVDSGYRPDSWGNWRLGSFVFNKEMLLAAVENKMLADCGYIDEWLENER